MQSPFVIHVYVCLFVYGCPGNQIAKKRSAHGFRGPSKPYRHLELLSYSHIRSIVDFIDNEGIDFYKQMQCELQNIPYVFPVKATYLCII